MDPIFVRTARIMGEEGVDLSLIHISSQGFEFSGVVFPEFHEARVVFGDCLAAFQMCIRDR